jgi:hypothetical protein
MLPPEQQAAECIVILPLVVFGQSKVCEEGQCGHDSRVCDDLHHIMLSVLLVTRCPLVSGGELSNLGIKR